VVDDSERRWVDDMAVAYDRWLGPAVFQPFADDLADRVAARSPDRILEVAAGTGRLTNTIGDRLPGASVTATDLSSAMVEYGRVAAPGASWQPADAGDLPFDDASFDAVACQFGMMFFPDRQATFAEIRRVTAPSGRFLANTWGRWEDHGFEVALLRALDHLFPDRPVTFLRSVPHGYHDPDVLAADLSTAGWAVRSVDAVVLAGTATANDLARGYCRGTPIRAEIEARSDLDATTDRVAELMQADLGTGAVTMDMAALVVEAVAAEAE
jgi:SAM-dependent methyltransferase